MCCCQACGTAGLDAAKARWRDEMLLWLRVMGAGGPPSEAAFAALLHACKGVRKRYLGHRRRCCMTGLH